MLKTSRAILAEFPIRSGIALAATLAARVVGALGGLALSYWLARAAGAEGLGQFTYIQSIVVILALIARMGSEHTLLRLVATLNEQASGAAALRYYLAALVSTLALAVVVALATVAAAGLGWLSSGEASLLAVLIWSLPPLVILSLNSGYLRGYHKVGLGMLLDVGTTSGLTAIVAWAAGQTTLSDIAFLFVVVSATLALVSLGGALAIARHHDGLIWGAVAPGAPSVRDFLLSGWPFAVIGVALFATQPGSFALVGSTLDDHTIGLLRAAERFAILVGFALTAISPFLAPRVATAYARSGVSGLQRVFRQAVLISIAAAVPVAIGVAIFGEWLLGRLGSEFVTAYPLLLILSTAQLIQACFGTSTTVLTMAGGEKASMWIAVVSLIAGCVLFPLLSRYYGGYGFAVTYLILIIVKEISTFWQIRVFTRRHGRKVAA